MQNRGRNEKFASKVTIYFIFLFYNSYLMFTLTSVSLIINENYSESFRRTDRLIKCTMKVTSLFQALNMAAFDHLYSTSFNLLFYVATSIKVVLFTYRFEFNTLGRHRSSLSFLALLVKCSIKF